MPKVDINGVPHFYQLSTPISPSSSPVLIFIHGWLLSSNYWQPLVAKLAPHYQCLSYDLRGFGDSQPPPDDSFAPKDEWQNPPKSNSVCSPSPDSLVAYAEDLKILLEKLNIEQAWLIGHSLGGSVALWSAHVCPYQVKGVICVNAGGGIYLKEEFERFRNAGQRLVKFRPTWLGAVPLLDWIFARMMVARPLGRRWGRQRVEDFLKANQEAAISSLLDSTTEEEVHLLPQIVSRLPQPVYFLAGAKDTIMEPKYVRHLASFHHLFQQHGSNVIEIADCGHLAMLERTTLVSQKIREIVREYESLSK
jgi:pimeloyl-ACP methyl ester carboxylesterase